MKNGEVIVIGGGHAGCEAALAAARIGVPTTLLTMSIDRLAAMPCNPSIGGIGKGHLVKEIDALGGEMARNADKSCLQMKILNVSKGSAVQAPRAQVDRYVYLRQMSRTVISQPGLSVIEEEAVGVSASGGCLTVSCASGRAYKAGAVVVAAGTFLNGKVIIGDTGIAAGRMGEAAANELTASLRKLGLQADRFQSATPPRVFRPSVDFSAMIEQPGDEPPLPLSYGSRPFSMEQISCWLTYTNEATARAVSDNLRHSPIMTGSVSTHGPRFCPSIDRKIINFPDRNRHPVFIEPEGLNSPELYLQGLTTAMPPASQEEIVRATPGLEKAVFTRYGYAIEYDYFPPQQLFPSLQSKVLPGLFLAGQINGTSGYEEAAAQGLVAGINAARFARGIDSIRLGRENSYIGVMIDDLVSKGVDEPYRVFTARSEYRLLLRCDNAYRRLTGIGNSVGLVDDATATRINCREGELDSLVEALRGSETASRVFTEALPALTSEIVSETGQEASLVERALIELKYAGYVERQKRAAGRLSRLAKVRLSPDIDYPAIESIRYETRIKLNEVKPLDLAQAHSVPGITVADISVLEILAKKGRLPV